MAIAPEKIKAKIKEKIKAKIKANSADKRKKTGQQIEQI
jgi:hypothetical protein